MDGETNRATSLARDGHAVAINGRHDDAQAHEVARSLQDDGAVAGAFTGDVTDEQQVTNLTAAIAARLGPLMSWS